MTSAKRDLVIRISGMLLLAVAVVAARALHSLVNSGTAHEATAFGLLLGFAIFLPASVGVAMLSVGAKLFEAVPPPVGRCRCPACRQARSLIG